MINNFLFRNPCLYETMSKMFIEWGRPEVTMWRTFIARWIPKPTNTHTQNMIYILFFSQQQFVYELASKFRYCVCC
jgi:hypothetical protein